MSTNVTTLTKEQAIVLAVQSLKVINAVESVSDIAARAGISRQYLHRLANERIAKEKAPCSDLQECQSSTPATSASDLSEPTIPGATGGESL
ncbi:MAG: hypothetical protein E6Q97_29795 [Desulfurellales bacterium]|nr:MAG: hypothetical protein E6Q97_29795 [Desulfurellales bacterium]